MSGPAAQARSHASVMRICNSATDARELRLLVVEEVRRAVPFDAYAWLLTDPETSVGTSPLAAVPCLPELPNLIRLKYLSELNRWTRLAGPVALLSEKSGGDLSRSLVWRELLNRYAVVDVASVVFTDQFGCWGFLDLWRTGSAQRFAPADASFLAGIAPEVATALRHTQADTFLAPAGQGLPSRGPVLLLLSSSLDVLTQTSETQEYLRVLVPPDGDRSPVPANAYNVAAQLLANEAGIDEHPPSARVHLSGGRWVTLRAARIEEPRAAQGRDIAVSIEGSSPAERASLFCRAYGLSVRESELLGHLLRGHGTADLSRLMFLSPHTVQDHFKSIFSKTAVHDRRTLSARVLGT